MFNKTAIFFLAFFLLILSFGMVCASENVTDFVGDDYSGITDTQIEVNKIDSYYKENNQFVCYLKDDNGTALDNKKVNISLNGKTYTKTTQSDGEVKLSLNLKPDSYNVLVNFAGDENFASSNANASIKIKKAPVTIKSNNNFATYADSDLFYKVTICNEITKKPVSGIKVLFKVYSYKTKKFTNYYRLTDENGIAKLNKNLDVGSYIVYTYLRDKNVYMKNYKTNKATVTIFPTAEWGCCSFYVQVNGTDSIAGFRRDATNALNIYIKNINWHGRTAVKQYKLAYSYFFHSITTSDGWMVGTGGIDNPSINKAIENLAGQMVKSNKIQTSCLKKIQNYERRLGLGHFSIKAPDGRYAVVWLNGYYTGKLKPGEYFSSPNLKSCYRHGSYEKFNSDPVKAAVKIGATDTFGVNRRDITIFHWKATTDKNYKTTSNVDVYACNDNGKLVGRSTGYLADNIYYKNSFISKNKLPKSPNLKFLGTHSFGNIDKLVKTPTIVNAPHVTNKFNTTKYFKVTVKNKNTKKVISGVKIKIKVSNDDFVKYVTLKTDSNGIAKLDTRKLSVGTYNVSITPANNVYYISAKSAITIK